LGQSGTRRRMQAVISIQRAQHRMTEITDEHIEWAVVDRLRQMLTEPSHREFNVTQSYSLFTTVLCWVMQRVRIRSHEVRPATNPRGRDDRRARALYLNWDNAPANADPWLLPTQSVPRIALVGGHSVAIPASVNFEHHSAARALVNLRDAAAHGDARNVIPMNASALGGGTLVGFRFRCEEKENRKTTWSGEMTLLETDMRRIGVALANVYCQALSSKNDSQDGNQFSENAMRVRELQSA